MSAAGADGADAAGASALAALARAAVAEDLGSALLEADHLGDDDELGDLTAVATLPAEVPTRLALAARSDGVVAGMDALAPVYAAVDRDVTVTPHVVDGDRVLPGEALATLEGPVRALVSGARAARNLLGQALAVATLTRRYVDAVAGTGVAIRGTRATLPGLRALQRAAVVAGGGHDHRMGREDALIVERTHIDLMGGIGPATLQALTDRRQLPVVVEVDDLDELDAALAAGAREVRCLGLVVDDLAEAVVRCRRWPQTVLVEAAGVSTPQSAPELAATGIDALAVPALTQAPPPVDLDLVVG